MSEQPIEYTLDWDLYLEIGQRSPVQTLTEDLVATLGVLELQPPEVTAKPLTLPLDTEIQEEPEDPAAKLLADADRLEEQTNHLLNHIHQRAQFLRFAVPDDDLALRAALLALQMDPDYLSFADYVDLLQLQLDLANSINDRPDETIIHAINQAEIITTFFERYLRQEISEAAVWAMQTKPLLKTGYTARVVKQYLVTYKEFPVNNTILAAMGGKASKRSLLDECIPCLDRTLSFKGFNPLQEFLSLLQAEINHRLSYINGLWVAANSRHINICDLLNYLNGLCIPDLFALLAILSYYWLQLTELMSFNVWKIIWSLIQPLLQSLLCSLNSLLERFIRLLVAPVECIITSIDHEYSKLYNLGRAMKKEFWTKGPQATKPYDHTFERWAKQQILNPVLYGIGPYGMGLEELKRTLINARDFVNSQIKRLRDAIKEALGLDADALGSAQGLFLILRWLSFVIALVKAMIRFKQDGYRCTPEGLTSAQYRVVVSYLQEITQLPYIVSEDLEIIREGYTTNITIPPGSSVDQTTISMIMNFLQGVQPSPTSQDFSALPQTGYVLPDCVAWRNELEAARVSSWIAELNQMVP